MNYTLIAENTTKRHLRVEIRLSLTVDNPEWFFIEENPVFTSRLYSLVGHDKRNKEICIERIRNGAWKILALKGTNICITYVLHSFVMSPEETYLSGDTWIINPKSALMVLSGLQAIRPTITLSASDMAFYCDKEIRHDIDGTTVAFDSFDEMWDYPMMGGLQILEFCIHKYRVVVKGEVDLIKADIETICKTIETQLTDLYHKGTIMLYIVPGHIEKRALEYGEHQRKSSCFGVIPTGPSLETELKEKIIYSIYQIELQQESIEYKGRCEWFLQGFAYERMIQTMKTWWSKEEYRLRVERCFIRTFSMERSLLESMIDAGYHKSSTYARDAGTVLCFLLRILFTQKGYNWSWTSSQDKMSLSFLLNEIETNYQNDLRWLWSLSLHTKETTGWLEVCKTYLPLVGFVIEVPKRGPIKVLYK